MSAKPYSLSGFVPADPGHAIESQIAKLRAQPGCRLVGVIEISRHSILEPDDEGEEPTVNLKITDLELARSREQDALLRLAMQALHLHRTAGGTLTEDDDIELAQDTLDKLPDLVSVHESARLRAALEWFIDQARGIASNNTGNMPVLLKRLVAKGEAALAGEQLTLDGTGTKTPARKAPVPARAKKDPLDVSGIPDDPAIGGAA